MTPAPDAAREAAFLAGYREGQADHPHDESAVSARLYLAGMEVADRATESASQPREGEVAEAMGHLEWLCGIAYNQGGAHELGYDPLAVVRQALTQRPPEQAGAVPAGEVEQEDYDLAQEVIEQIIADRVDIVADDAGHLRDSIATALCRSRTAVPTPPDAGPGEIPAGMVAWHGGDSGDSAPKDWDPKGKVMFRDGEIVDCETDGEPYWDHVWGDADIIAYTPKAPPQTPPDAGIGSDGAGERVMRHALQDIADAEAIPNDAVAFVWCRDVARQALATQPGDGGRS